MNKIAVAASALALLGFASVANAGDMKDQGPINANPPAFGATLSKLVPTVVNGPYWGSEAGPVNINSAFSGEAAAAPQVADNLQGKVYQAPAE